MWYNAEQDMLFLLNGGNVRSSGCGVAGSVCLQTYQYIALYEHNLLWGKVNTAIYILAEIPFRPWSHILLAELNICHMRYFFFLDQNWDEIQLGRRVLPFIPVGSHPSLGWGKKKRHGWQPALYATATVLPRASRRRNRGLL